MPATARPFAASNGLPAYGLLLFMGITWGLAVSLSKIAGTAGGHPVGLALWQVSVSGSMLSLIALFSCGLPPITRPVIRFGLFCGVTGVAFPAIALFASALHLPAGVVAIAFASMPLFTYGLSVGFGLEQGEVRRLAGVVLGLGAMALLILPEGALPEPGLWPWVLLALAASISMSVENFYAGAYRPVGVNSLQLSAARQLGAVIFLLPIALATSTAVSPFESWSSVQWAATGTGIISGTAYTILLYVIATSGPVFASQTAYVITLAGVGWGMLLFGERHSIYIWAALALTLLAVALVRPRAPRASGLAKHARYPASTDREV